MPEGGKVFESEYKFELDSEVEEGAPSLHTRVSGHFAGTGFRCNFYFPPSASWEGRFFHHVYPLYDEHGDPRDVAFALASGGYLVRTNGGRSGYRVDAAAAQVGRRLAAERYGTDRRVYGYIWGGSGGSFQTLGAIENTIGIWDGAVPYVVANETSIPNNNSILALGTLALADRLPDLADAVAPGGKGVDSLDLTDSARAVLKEATDFGVPLRAWEAYGLMEKDNSMLMTLSGGVMAADPTFVDDFWTEPGYEGQNPPEYLRAALVEYKTQITFVDRDDDDTAVAIELENVPDVREPWFDQWIYDRDGAARLGAIRGRIEGGPNRLVLSHHPGTFRNLDAGQHLVISNRSCLAMHFYHRHRIPDGPQFSAWDQYRQRSDTPRFPQRAGLPGAGSAAQATGGYGAQTGVITCKTILVDNLIDWQALPWGGHLYATRVKQSLGSAFDDNFRIWFNDNADHLDWVLAPDRARFFVDYVPSLFQALRDVAAWVEQGVSPPSSTVYTVEGGRIEVAGSPADRLGIQPFVELQVEGGPRVEVSPGQQVTFTGRAEPPPKTGQLVLADWDFHGSGQFESVPFGAPKDSLDFQTTFTYHQAGTYFAGLRVSSQRDGNVTDRHTLVQNLARVRVVVK